MNIDWRWPYIGYRCQKKTCLHIWYFRGVEQTNKNVPSGSHTLVPITSWFHARGSTLSLSRWSLLMESSSCNLSWNPWHIHPMTPSFHSFYRNSNYTRVPCIMTINRSESYHIPYWQPLFALFSVACIWIGFAFAIIAMLDSDLACDTHKSRKICVSLGFPRSFSLCCTRRGTIFLHLHTTLRRVLGVNLWDMWVHMDVHKV